MIVTYIEVNSMDSLQCGVCLNSHAHRPDGEKMNKIYRTQKGCFAPQSSFVHKANSGKGMQINYSKCPANFVNYEYGALFELVKPFQNGIMPFNGAILDQPCKIVELLNIVVSLREEKSEKLEQQKQKKNAQIASRMKSGR